MTLPLQQSCREIRWGLFGHLQPSRDKWLQAGGTDTKNMAHALTRLLHTHTFSHLHQEELQHQEFQHHKYSITDSKGLLQEVYIAELNTEHMKPTAWGPWQKSGSYKFGLDPESLKEVNHF